ncbi:MAG: hypothetical protein K5891_10860 [Lachnospiraceae bacterium]|nr:hypothetical protein [Lachnospiraceae bacterium]
MKRVKTMTFFSPIFFIFLPVVAWVHYHLPGKHQYLWLLSASLVFYLSGGPAFAAGLLVISLITYGAVRGMEKSGPKRSAAFLAGAILLTILMLVLFRYGAAAGDEASVLPASWIPAGFSFYALTALGYVMDVYYGRTEPEHHFGRYLLFVAFFPSILSGPILRADKMLPQIREGRTFDYEKSRSGLYQMLYGYLLKVLVADRLAPMVAEAFDHYTVLSGATLLWGAVLYGIQLYCDFAGYSAIALGAGRFLGYDLPVNFRQPYFAPSVADFWHRWHISLSEWLRDEIYIPLGGNRKGKARKMLNLMITFLVSGFWHGNGANFLFWGGLHGAYQVAGKASPSRSVRPCLARILRCVRTFLLVDLAWIFFRAPSFRVGADYVYRIVTSFHLRTMTYYGEYLLGQAKGDLALILLCILAVFVLDLLREKGYPVASKIAGLPGLVRWALYLVLVLFMLLVSVRYYGEAASTFIYARF